LFDSGEQMEELLENEVAFDIFFHSLDRVKNLKTFQEDLRSGNEQLARNVNVSRVREISYTHCALFQIRI
jgi:hypothetical protein